MTLSIGRAGKSSPLLLNDPSMWAEQSGTSTVAIISHVATPVDALRLRDQLLGYLDNFDEPIVPVICDVEPRRTGYYRVAGVQIDTDPEAVGLGIFTAYVSLVPVIGFTQPLLESIISGALLTNGVGGVLGDVHAFHAVSANATEYSYAGVLSVFSTRNSSDGNLIFLDTGQTLTSTARHGLAASNFYMGAATFEQGSALMPVVGRSLTQIDLVNWRLSNGLVRVTPNATAGKLDVSHYNGSSWSAAKTYALSATLSPVGVGPDGDTETITTSGGPVTEGIGVIASFKPATTIARVGALGAFTTGTASSVSPTFGQATTAANLLVAWIAASKPGITTAAAGWVQAQTASSTGGSAIWYKPNCGAGEAAPTFTATAGGASPMHAQLAEFSGAALAAPVDKVGFGFTIGGTSLTANNSAADGTANDLVVTAAHWNMTSAATATLTTAYNSANVVAAGNSGAASGASGHSNFAYGIIGAALNISLTGWNSLVVLRNSVEETIIRLSVATSYGATAGIILLDVSLRRGDRMARIYVTSSGISLTFKLARNSVEAATAVTYGAVTLGGIRATANDGDSNRYVLLSVQRAAPVNDLVNGAITQGAAGTTADYAIGSEIGGSSAVLGLDDAASLARQYLAAQSESQRIVVR